MITRLKIGPIIFSVERAGSEAFGPKEKGELISGESRPDECNLLINHDHHLQQQHVALFHEILHIVLLQGGRTFESEDDGLISVLAHGMLQVLCDNQWLCEDLPRLKLDGADELGG